VYSRLADHRNVVLKRLCAGVAVNVKLHGVCRLLFTWTCRLLQHRHHRHRWSYKDKYSRCLISSRSAAVGVAPLLCLQYHCRHSACRLGSLCDRPTTYSSIAAHLSPTLVAVLLMIESTLTRSCCYTRGPAASCSIATIVTAGRTKTSIVDMLDLQPIRSCWRGTTAVSAVPLSGLAPWI
jgi:hypothetical protein